MPKYLEKQIFTHGSFPEVGQKQKTERERKKERRPKVDNNNSQLRIAMPPRVAHAKPPGQLVHQKSFWQVLAVQQGLPKQTAPVLTHLRPDPQVRPHSGSPQGEEGLVGGDGTGGS